MIAGGSGLVGNALTPLLLDAGYEVIWLSRRKLPNAPVPVALWNPAAGDFKSIESHQPEALINLAGAGIAEKRWSGSRKKEIIDSRVLPNQWLAQWLAASGHPLRYISASAIGYYGHQGETVCDENHAPGTGFLSQSTTQWEHAIERVAATGTPTAWIRIGIVFSTLGGALPQMLPPAKLRVPVIFGDGKAWMSWIHIHDLCGAFLHLLKHPHLTGPYNGVAPNPVRNGDLARALLEALDTKGIPMPVPAPLLRLAMGEMADMVLESTRVRHLKLEQTGFIFQHPLLVPALKHLLHTQC